MKGSNSNVLKKHQRSLIIQGIYGIKPVMKYTNLPEQPVGFIERNHVYLEDEKYVQNWEMPVLDGLKNKLKGKDRDMLETVKGPCNSLLDSDEEFDAELDYVDKKVKFEEEIEGLDLK